MESNTDTEIAAKMQPAPQIAPVQQVAPIVATKLVNRLTAHVKPKNVSGVQGYQHPPENALNFNNPVVGVIFRCNFAYFNVMMKDGNNGTLNYSKKQDIKMTKEEQVAKITIY